MLLKTSPGIIGPQFLTFACRKGSQKIRESPGFDASPVDIGMTADRPNGNCAPI
jgi:hypothetical protein